MAGGSEDNAAPRAEVDVAVESLTKRLHEARYSEADLRARIKALVDGLVAAGVLPPEEFERRRRQELQRELGRLREHPLYRHDNPTVDKYALTDLPQIDCASILPICQARCCKLEVHLSPQDLDERKLHWDYANPYRMRRRADGYCVHSGEGTHACTVYDLRPATCRSYDCRDDDRIWDDFERRILAPDPTLPEGQGD